MSLLFNALKRSQGTEISAQQSPRRAVNAYLAALLILSIAAIWYFYSTQTKHIELAPPVAPAPVAVSDASAVLAALPATASGADSPVQKTWTHPLKPVKAKSKKRLPIRQVTADKDPLKEGYLALKAGDLDLAEQRYQEALVRQPHEKDALLGLAIIAQRSMQPSRATELYRQVLREDLGNATAAAGLVSMQTDPLTAESQIRELLDLKPSAAEFHYALGGVLARQLRWAEAQQAFSRACRLSPENALYSYNLAVALDHLHQDAAALTFYEKTLRLANDPTLNMDVIARRIQELKSSP